MGLLDVDHGHVLPFRWVQVKLSCMERLDDSTKKQWWHLTNTLYVETPELVTYIQRYCGGIIHVTSRIETEASFNLEMDGVQMVEISKTFQEMTISADGRVSTTERTQSFVVPAPTFPVPQPGSSPDTPGPDAASGCDAPGSDTAASGPGTVHGTDAACPNAAGPDATGGAADSSAGSLSSAQGSGDSNLLLEALQVPSLY
ncbi:hypothetical protein AALO_G00274120 [Alosa alosa]|uniref:Uncharacterized protein n=1 Tax=Alosa alosa TaxID=278164 RepID=A0AAV6FMP1_9TELE|nr:hypothetical protein AALO_G00274120 [Alosa alosa]